MLRRTVASLPSPSAERCHTASSFGYHGIIPAPTPWLILVLSQTGTITITTTPPYSVEPGSSFNPAGNTHEAFPSAAWLKLNQWTFVGSSATPLPSGGAAVDRH